MFGFRYIKFDSMTYVIQFKNGRIAKEGRGLSFFYFAPSSSISAVPMGSDDLPFIFNETTSDYQDIFIQGQVTYRVGNPRQLAELLDFTVDGKGTHKKNEVEKLNQRIINEAQTATSSFIHGLGLKEAIRSAKAIESRIINGLQTSAALSQLGIEILTVNVVSVKATPEMARALETETREKLSQDADQAIYERRNFAVEQERMIKESELNTEIAVEEKKKQIVIVIGQDGLVANTAKYVNGIPIVAVNPEIERYDGFLLPFNPVNFLDGVKNVISGKFKFRSITLAEAMLNDKQRLLAFNDLFIGASTHISARYKITFGKKTEEQSSSGVIVSTKAGSTGWLSSIFNMTAAMHKFIVRNDEKRRAVPLKDNQLMFVVREPFQSKKTDANLAAGILSEGSRLVIESFMPSNGVIFSDGIEADFLAFNSGSTATITTAKEKARLVTLA